MARFEELHRLERRLYVVEHQLVVRRESGRRIALGRPDDSRCIRSGHVQLVEGQQHGLRQVQRAVLGGRNSHHKMGTVHGLVGQSTVLPPEQQRDTSLLGSAPYQWRGSTGIREGSLGRAASSREGGDLHTIGKRFVERVKMLDSLDNVGRAVRDAGEPYVGVLAGAHETEIRRTHVLHGAHGRTNVHRILWLEQNNDYTRENGFWHGVRY